MLELYEDIQVFTSCIVRHPCDLVTLACFRAFNSTGKASINKMLFYAASFVSL